MRWYVDSSVAVHALLPGGAPEARAWIDATAAGGEIYSSSLLRLEIIRVLRRDGRDPSVANAVTGRVNLIIVDEGVLRIAAALEPHVRTLDAIHLATCLMLGSAITLVTHDAQMINAADSLGIDTMDPLTGQGSRRPPG